MISSVEIMEGFSLAINLNKLMYLYLNGLAPPAERFQGLCDLVSTSSQARYYVWCRMRNDVGLSLLVFFNLYLWLHVDSLNYGHQIHNIPALQFDSNLHREARIARRDMSKYERSMPQFHMQ
jgi:hypothetical protein